MKKLISLTVLVVTILGLQFMTHCTKPLDIDSEIFPPPDTLIVVDTLGLGDTIFINDTIWHFDTLISSDTVFIVDTLMYFDTTIVIDTLPFPDTTFIIDTFIIYDTFFVIDSFTNIDTMFVIDTLAIVDTVIIEIPDTTGSQFLCAQLGASQKEIVWMLRNQAEKLRLEFVALVERPKPVQMLRMDIGGRVFDWYPTENMEFILEEDFEENLIITIKPEPPNAFGHDIDVCLTIKKP
jgi:hypothetical protein